MKTSNHLKQIKLTWFVLLIQHPKPHSTKIMEPPTPASSSAKRCHRNQPKATAKQEESTEEDPSPSLFLVTVSASNVVVLLGSRCKTKFDPPFFLVFSVGLSPWLSV
jgi:hypothetical protein